MKDVKWAIEEIEKLEREVIAIYHGARLDDADGDGVFYHGKMWGYAKALDVLREVDAEREVPEPWRDPAKWRGLGIECRADSSRAYWDEALPDGRMLRYYGPWSTHKS